MSTNKEDETPANITTDAESQEYGAQHGQTIEGQNTGSSDPEAGDNQGGDDPAETGEGTGARAGAYS
jgi:hypothetical protein